MNVTTPDAFCFFLATSVHVIPSADRWMTTGRPLRAGVNRTVPTSLALLEAAGRAPGWTYGADSVVLPLWVAAVAPTWTEPVRRAVTRTATRPRSRPGPNRARVDMRVLRESWKSEETAVVEG